MFDSDENINDSDHISDTVEGITMDDFTLLMQSNKYNSESTNTSVSKNNFEECKRIQADINNLYRKKLNRSQTISSKKSLRFDDNSTKLTLSRSESIRHHLIELMNINSKKNYRMKLNVDGNQVLTSNVVSSMKSLISFKRKF